jgi:hypothetical protein
MSQRLTYVNVPPAASGGSLSVFTSQNPTLRQRHIDENTILNSVVPRSTSRKGIVGLPDFLTDFRSPLKEEMKLQQKPFTASIPFFFQAETA